MPSDYPGFEKYAGWLAIPYLAADGHPMSVRFRRPDWLGAVDGPKYLSLPHEPGRVYGVSSFLGGGADLHVAEGEFDAMILRKVFGAAVGYPGATFWKSYHRVLFEGFVNIYVWGDGDPAGRKFTSDLGGRLKNVVEVHMPTDEDVTSLYMKHGGAKGDGIAALERMIS